ncbi:hypothetical protein HPO96_18575 [Kribbella sandramycini]|uniref:Uncharacterized protein n=1 Tax=Kribbella sandramycini TaxID=60450 RepID=A0A7Y4L0V5_9ACTN|nr:hypothetical protein [Kribbella sandramycini]MBB6564551.1 hypothetical protein [Kribbella sandramycini]NOL42255.1 hypothetical protein [Kribbella sandramycini]
MGSSWGAEAALLLGALDERVDAVVAFAPSAYVWGRVDNDGRQRSAWTWRGEPLPFVPFDLAWQPGVLRGDRAVAGEPADASGRRTGCRASGGVAGRAAEDRGSADGARRIG